jgi:hypothetical protein
VAVGGLALAHTSGAPQSVVSIVPESSWGKQCLVTIANLIILIPELSTIANDSHPPALDVELIWWFFQFRRHHDRRLKCGFCRLKIYQTSGEGSVSRRLCKAKPCCIFAVFLDIPLADLIPAAATLLFKIARAAIRHRPNRKTPICHLHSAVATVMNYLPITLRVIFVAFGVQRCSWEVRGASGSENQW